MLLLYVNLGEILLSKRRVPLQIFRNDFCIHYHVVKFQLKIFECIIFALYNFLQ